MWLVLSEISGEGAFETPKEFNIEPNSTFDIPVRFKPKTIGKHEVNQIYNKKRHFDHQEGNKDHQNKK